MWSVIFPSLLLHWHYSVWWVSLFVVCLSPLKWKETKHHILISSFHVIRAKIRWTFLSFPCSLSSLVLKCLIILAIHSERRRPSHSALLAAPSLAILPGLHCPQLYPHWTVWLRWSASMGSSWAEDSCISSCYPSMPASPSLHVQDLELPINTKKMPQINISQM